MLLEILLSILLGVLFGVFTGLIPGIHINLISALLVSSAAIVFLYVGVVPVVCFIIAMSVTHSFLDVIPSVYLGAPDPDMVLSVLPGHKLLLQGLGMHAVWLTQVGSLAATILSCVLFPLFCWLVIFSSDFLNQFMPLILLTLTLFLLFIAPKTFLATLIFLLAGALGLLTFHLPLLQNPLFPLLTGLFGISTLLMSFESGGIPEQKNSPLELSFFESFAAIITGQVAGFLTAVFPGLGSASAATLSSAFVKLKENAFLILIGSIGTVNFILSLVTYFLLNKARNGSIVAIQTLIGEVPLQLIFIMIGTTLLAGGIASLILAQLTPLFVTLLENIPYTLLIKSVIFLLVLLAAILSGWYGLLILVTATALGILAPNIGVQRIYLMGCLLLPVLTYFWL